MPPSQALPMGLNEIRRDEVSDEATHDGCIQRAVSAKHGHTGPAARTNNHSLCGHRYWAFAKRGATRPAGPAPPARRARLAQGQGQPWSAGSSTSRSGDREAGVSRPGPLGRRARLAQGRGQPPGPPVRRARAHHRPGPSRATLGDREAGVSRIAPASCTPCTDAACLGRRLGRPDLRIDTSSVGT